MSLVIYNTLTRKKEAFEPMAAPAVKLYICGVTTYDLCHIGHARCYVAFDTVQRYLRYSGFDVTMVRNITDVDDKIIARSHERGVSPKALADQFIEEMYTDFDALDIQRGDVEPRVSDTIPEIIQMVEQLVSRGLAYEVEGDVYFDVHEFPPYGVLSGRDIDQLKSGARVDVDTRKRNATDFALWKAAKPGDPFWESPWGQGRPGWHIECSAMSVKHLGEEFDIHGGGMDLVFPHHENEIAQSHGAHGCAPVRYWMHNGFVNVDNEKMSKSLGNFFTIRHVLQRYHPQTVRLFLLGTHYRHPINYSDQNLDESAARITYLYDTLGAVDDALATGIDTESGPLIEEGVLEGILPGFVQAMDNDFNTPGALGHLSEVLKLANQVVRMKKKRAGRGRTLRLLRERLSEVSSVLGVLNHEPQAVLAALRDKAILRAEIDPALVETLLERRAAARAEKDWAAADLARDEIAALGVEVMDTPTGTSWRPTLGAVQNG
jgi:cysteinyl-tRNA synthetase